MIRPVEILIARGLTMDQYDVNSFFISLRNIEHNLRKKYPQTRSVDELVTEYLSNSAAPTKSLDLGCGSALKNPFRAQEAYGTDLRDDIGPLIKQADLAVESIPYPSNYFNYCTAFDFIEHIPRNYWINGKTRYCFIELMNEIHRVLQPGGLFLHLTPAYPSLQAFQDPTHVNIITEDTFPLYFCEPDPLAKTIGYGFKGTFELVKQAWIWNNSLVGIMRAIKQEH